MARFRLKIENKYGVKTFQETKNTHDWIYKSLIKCGFTNSKITSDFSFDISNIHCSCYNIEEFIENAFGQNEYVFGCGHIEVWFEHEIIASILYSSTSVSISSSSKIVLDKIINSLKETTLEDAPLHATTYIANQTTNTITVNGDNNNIANDNSSVVTLPKEKKEGKLKQWLRAIGQNIISNIVWYILGLIVAVLIPVIMAIVK